MFDQRIKYVMDRKKVIKTSPGTTVRKAAEMMRRKRVGAMLVCEADRLIGIFTERDALFRVLAQGLDPEVTQLRDVMTPDPMTIGPEDYFGRALLIMFDHGFRHLPVLDGGVPVGLISSRSALDPDLEEFVPEAKRREHYRHRH
jgi:CBS domain-containing protein